jgi:Cu2+-exporting ATPase
LRVESREFGAAAIEAPPLGKLPTLNSRLPTARDCAHCGLPLRRRTVSATVAGEPSRFCCYGCVLAQQVTRARGEHGTAESILIRLGLAIFFAMNVMMVSMPSYVPYVYGTGADDGPLFQVLRVVAVAFAAPVIGLLGWPILLGAARGLRDGAANTDALIVLGTAAAYVLSVINTVAGHGPVYFDTAAMLLVLVTLGRYLEARAKADAGAAVRATLAPAPAVAIRVSVAAGQVRATSERQTETVSPEVLAPGDIVRVAPGDAFPADGLVIDGTGGADEAALTGEQRAVLKEPGSTVASGTCSIDGLFHVRVTARAAESAAARVAALLSAARRERAPAERLADRVASALVPVVVAVAVAAATWWTLHAGFDTGLLVGLAVLVVACPCGLGIATPVALWTGLVTAARRGVIVRSAPAFERAAHIDHVLFDKTGTLTERRPRLVAVEPAAGSNLSQHDVLCRAAALEAGLKHPLAVAVAAAWQQTKEARPEPGRRGCPLRATQVQVVAGRGVRGVVAGESLAAGSVNFAAQDLGNAIFRLHADAPGSVVLLWRPRQLLGALRFTEAPRLEAAAALDQLRQAGIRSGLVSGDRCADAVVPALIGAADAALGLLPEDKVAYIRSVRWQKGAGTVAMVGDGVNDAPALAAADVGIAVGDASDLARMAADVAIVSNDLRRVPWLITYSRRVNRVMRENLFWAFAYNAVAVIAAAAGALNPLVASVAMLASSLAVVANARRLRLG